MGQKILKKKTEHPNQSDFDDQMKLRERSISQESYHSQPKSWSEFESETKEWRVSFCYLKIIEIPVFL